MIHIVTDATTDFPKQFYEKDFTVLPMGYMLDDEDFDGETKTITAKEFYDYMRAGRKTNTRMVDEATILKYVEPLLKEGKDVLYVVFSSGLSGTYDNAVRVFKELHEKYPACKLAAVDSYNASMGEGLLVWYTLKKRAEGASFEELCKYVEDTQAHLCSYFTVDDLKHLARLGRVTKTAAFIGSLANIKPVLFVNSKGKLIPIAKVVSRKKSLKALVDKMEEKMLPVSEQRSVCQERNRKTFRTRLRCDRLHRSRYRSSRRSRRRCVVLPRHRQIREERHFRRLKSKDLPPKCYVSGAFCIF